MDSDSSPKLTLAEGEPWGRVVHFTKSEIRAYADVQGDTYDNVLSRLIESARHMGSAVVVTTDWKEEE